MVRLGPLRCLAPVELRTPPDHFGLPLVELHEHIASRM
nr:hypothetical protein JVH1_6944 [Rhodococcus sp. JVH1]